MAHKEWRSPYFVNISLNFHCLGFISFSKDAPFIFLQNCMKRNSCDEYLRNNIWSTLSCSKESRFQATVFVFKFLLHPFTGCKKTRYAICSLWETLSVKNILFWHTVNMSEQNPFFFPHYSCFKDLRFRLIKILI